MSGMSAGRYAKRVHDSGLTLREYLWAVQTHRGHPDPDAGPDTRTDARAHADADT